MRGFRLRWPWLLLGLFVLPLLLLPQLGHLSKRTDNGAASTTYSRTNGGDVYRVEGTGLGPSYTTYGLQGQPVWESDGAGNQVVRVTSYSPDIDSTVEVRLDNAGGKHTTSQVSWLDEAGQATETMEYASGKERRTSFLRNASGFVKDQTDAQGFHTLFEPNFLGWPDTVKEQSPSGYDVAHYTYNGRGQVTSVIDPGGLETSLEYDGFGAVISRTLHTSPLEAVTFTYDALSRLATRTSATSSVLHHYNFRGDPDFERFNGSSQKLSSRTFDSLGRVVDSINFNPALTWLPEQKRMVSRGLTYDALGRVASDTLAVGQAPAGTVTSTWSLSGGTWKRELRHPGAAATPDWTESYDGAGRLSLETRPNGAGTLATSFDFEGPLYTGRRQQLPGWTSQFTEDFTLDELGQTVGIRYGAQDVTASGQPRYPAEGSVYCGGTWAAADCSGPLLEVALLRDKVGRVVSDKPTFGYPVLRGNSGPRVAGAPHARPWRGFAYDSMGRLSQEWTHPGVGGEVTTGTLATHFVTPAHISALGTQAGVTPWQYQRETTVGDLKAVVDTATGVTRFAATNVSHQQRSVTVDGRTRSLTYDGEGRLGYDGQHGYSYDARGPLAAEWDGRDVEEAYAYDDSGRLAAVFEERDSTPKETFAYDGAQMVAGYEEGQQLRWEAAWGPGVDKLVEYRDVDRGEDFVPLADYRNSVVGAWSQQRRRMRQTAEYSPEGRVTLRDADESVSCREEGPGRRVCPPPGRMPFGFQSAWRSEETGLVFMRNRWYSPELGVFTSQDPVGYVDSFNPYAYVGFDPVNGWDPFGLETKSLADKGGAPGGRGYVIIPASIFTEQFGRNRRQVVPDPRAQVMAEIAGRATVATTEGLLKIQGAGALNRGAVAVAQPGALARAWGWVRNVVTRSARLSPPAPSLPPGGMRTSPLEGPGAAARSELGGVEIGGKPWKPMSVSDPACSSGCEEVAATIKNAIGGEIKTIRPAGVEPPPVLGRVRDPGGTFVRPGGEAGGWAEHQVVVKEGRVYDALTGPEGETFGQYKGRWEYGNDIDFGF